MSTRLFALSGTPVQASGGETSCPSQVYLVGISPWCSNADDVIESVMDAPPSSDRARPNDNAAAIAAIAHATASHPGVHRPGVDRIGPPGLTSCPDMPAAAKRPSAGGGSGGEFTRSGAARGPSSLGPRPRSPRSGAETDLNARGPPNQRPG